MQQRRSLTDANVADLNYLRDQVSAIEKKLRGLRKAMDTLRNPGLKPMRIKDIKVRIKEDPLAAAAKRLWQKTDQKIWKGQRDKPSAVESIPEEEKISETPDNEVPAQKEE